MILGEVWTWASIIDGRALISGLLMLCFSSNVGFDQLSLHYRHHILDRLGSRQPFLRHSSQWAGLSSGITNFHNPTTYPQHSELSRHTHPSVNQSCISRSDSEYLGTIFAPNQNEGDGVWKKDKTRWKGSGDMHASYIHFAISCTRPIICIG